MHMDRNEEQSQVGMCCRMDRVFELDWHFIKDVKVKELIYNFQLFFQTIMFEGL